MVAMSGASASANVNGRAYEIVDHSFDVVVVGAGGSGLRAVGRLRQGGPARRLRDKGVSDALAYGRGAGRRRGGARQYGAGRLEMAHVRHRQGLRLARRPGRDRIFVPQRARGRLRTRTLGRALFAHRGRPHLSASVRRHDDRLRQGPAGAAHLRRRRPHRPRHVAHALRPGAETRHRVLRRIFRARSDHGFAGALPRRRVPQTRRRHDPSFSRRPDRAGHRRLWPRLSFRHLGAHLHRRRQRHGAARGPAVAGHGVRAVPPDRHLRRRLPHHRGRAWRGRLSHQ